MCLSINKLRLKTLYLLIYSIDLNNKQVYSVLIKRNINLAKKRVINIKVNYIAILAKVTNLKDNLTVKANLYIQYKKINREDRAYGTKSEGYH